MADPGRVVVAMSGGVDSGLAALLLAEAGYEVIGITLQLYETADGRGSGAEAASAREAVEAAGGTHHLIDARQRFRELVISGFASEYAAGRTPNPCVRCNEQIKWAILEQAARTHRAAYMATGHYARTGTGADGPVLMTARDTGKDQSYVLWRIGRPALAATLFPLGEMTKEEVRARSRRHGLTAAGRDESQDICFIPAGDYGTFLDGLAAEIDDADTAAALRSALTPGEIVDLEGGILGTHRGIARYTIGQRHGLGIAAGHPLYVIALDPAARRVVVGEESVLKQRSLLASGAVWTSIEPPAEPFRAEARVRYRGARTPAFITPGAGDSFTVRFEREQRAAAPGQSVVLYDGEIVLGGGIITPAGNEVSGELP